MIKNIGILTSGGDAPGMNVIIKTIVEDGIKNNINVYGIKNGFYGLYKNKIKILKIKNVFNITDQGGTYLQTSRFTKFKKYKIRKKAIKNLKKNNIQLLIVIGGEGSHKGAKKLTKMSFPCITLPGTIDNDIINTDYTVGFFTALNTINEAIKKIKDTSFSHERISILEVMGRNCGDLALYSGIANNCKIIITPQKILTEKQIIEKVKKNITKYKNYEIIIITENIYNIHQLAKKIEQKTSKETRATSLGYIQRGGAPVIIDKILAIKISKYTIKLIKKNIFNKFIGIKNNKITSYNI